MPICFISTIKWQRKRGLQQGGGDCAINAFVGEIETGIEGALYFLVLLHFALQGIKSRQLMFRFLPKPVLEAELLGIQFCILNPSDFLYAELCTFYGFVEWRRVKACGKFLLSGPFLL